MFETSDKPDRFVQSFGLHLNQHVEGTDRLYVLG